MEAMHKDSCACAKSELDLFSVPPTQVEMEKGFWEDIDPITSIAASDTIEFLCAANSGVYTDLASSYLHVKAKITAADGANLDADVQVGPVNLWLHALFSQVEVFLNNKLVTPSSTAYPYRAYIETILNFSKDAKDSHLTSALFYKDKAGKMDSVVVSYIRYWTPIPRQTLGAWISRHKCVGSTNQQWSKTTFNPKMTSFITRVVHEDDV